MSDSRPCIGDQVIVLAWSDWNRHMPVGTVWEVVQTDWGDKYACVMVSNGELPAWATSVVPATPEEVASYQLASLGSGDAL